MIFEDERLNQIIENNNIIQMSFMTKHALEYYKGRLLNEGYYDLTKLFLTDNLNSIDFNLALGITTQTKCIFDLNQFFNYWVIVKDKPYTFITQTIYTKLKDLLEKSSNQIIAIGHKRSIDFCKRHKVEILDNILFCDFADVYMYPVYHEFKLFCEDMVSFNEFVTQVQATGEVPNKYNMVHILYMKTNDKEIINY